MPHDMTTDTEPAAQPPGLRERKRRATAERIAHAARTLFRERGFDATTVDQIALAAGVSRRSFFHHFASKEDVIFAGKNEMEAALTSAIASQPPDEPLLRVARRAVVAAASHFDRDEAVALARLMHDSPAVRVRNHVRYEELERVMAARLGERLGGNPDRLRARLVAMVAIGALRVAGETWLAKAADDERPEDYARRVFRTLSGELAK